MILPKTRDVEEEGMGAAQTRAAEAKEVVNTEVPARIVAAAKIKEGAKAQEITGIPGNKTPFRLSRSILSVSQ